MKHELLSHYKLLPSSWIPYECHTWFCLTTLSCLQCSSPFFTDTKVTHNSNVDCIECHLYISKSFLALGSPLLNWHSHNHWWHNTNIPCLVFPPSPLQLKAPIMLPKREMGVKEWTGCHWEMNYIILKVWNTWGLWPLYLHYSSLALNYNLHFTLHYL
jgi:hypothetical protein